MTPATRSRLTILTGAAALLIFFLHLLGALANAEAWLLRGLAPQELKLADAARSFRRLVSAPLSIDGILAENESLKEERDALLIEVANLRNIEDENASLRDLLKFSKKTVKLPVIAHVLASTPDSGAHTVLIDRGSDDGLKIDLPVIVNDGIVVGKILKAERATALVLLLTDTSSRIGATVEDSAKTMGMVQGQRGLSLEMSFIPQNDEIKPGDLVVTSGIEPLIARGLVIGRVQDVQTEERNPFKTATITSPVSYNQLDVVAVPLP